MWNVASPAFSRYRGVEDFRAVHGDLCVEPAAGSFTERSIGLNRSHVEPVAQVMSGVVAIAHTEIENKSAVVCVTRHYRPDLSFGMA